MIKNNMQQIAKNIRQLRESKYYSQDYMAAKIGLSQNGYSKIELGYSRLTVERLLQIAALLETDAVNLMNMEEMQAA